MEYTQAKGGLDVFVSTGRYLGHGITLSQPTVTHFSPSFSSALKLTGQWALQRICTLRFSFFPVENLQNQ